MEPNSMNFTLNVSGTQLGGKFADEAAARDLTSLLLLDVALRLSRHRTHR
jgi:hypothetical protein